VRLELGRAGEIAQSMYAEIKIALADRNREHLAEIARRDDQVDILEAAILDYLRHIRQGILSEQESRVHESLMSAAVNLEGLADVIETDLVELAGRYIDNGYQTGETTLSIMERLHELVGEALALSIKAVRDDDQKAAEAVRLMKGDINRVVEEFLARKSERLGKPEEDYLATARTEMSLVDKLRRIFTHAKRIAKVVLPEPLAARE